jgi:signal peptidase I
VIYKLFLSMSIALIVLLSIPIVCGFFPGFFIIQSDSMLPVIEKGDLVFFRNENLNQPDYRNKVIAYHDPVEARITVHRVIGTNGDYLLTKGDNGAFVDFYSPTRSDILGVYWFKLPFRIFRK